MSLAKTTPKINIRGHYFQYKFQRRENNPLFFYQTHKFTTFANMIKNLFFLLLCFGCTNSSTITTEKVERNKPNLHDSLPAVKELRKENYIAINDTLNSIAQLIGGNADSSNIFTTIISSKKYQTFAANFSKRWATFDTSRIQKLTRFRDNELSQHIKAEKILFYPFSGPDILYANVFFPNADKYVMIGLEPVGSLPPFANIKPDSLTKYYNKINTSLNAILNFSFFRTESMSEDLKNTEVNGTIHLLLLFLNRMGHKIISVKPISIDTTGNKIYFPNFKDLKVATLKTKGIEIFFKTDSNQVKELNYFSLNAADDGLKKNTGFTNYLNQMGNFNAYLKGASYLLHKPNFSIIRNIILEGANTLTQDDSGIALKYLEKEKWDFTLYGNYSKPISMFHNCYQKNLDSLYKKNKPVPLGFGIGYNFKDKNSNLMVINRR